MPDPEKTDEQMFSEAFDEDQLQDEEKVNTDPVEPAISEPVVEEPVVAAPVVETALDYKALYEKEVQKTSSWDGRIKAANKRADEAEAALKLLQESRGKEPVTPPAITSDSTLTDFFAEFPELKTPLTLIVQNEVTEKIAAAMSGVMSKIEPVISSVKETVETNSTAKHFSAILAAHPDFETIRDSGLLKIWVDSQSPIIRESLNRVLYEGSADEVIEMYDMYKKVNKPKPNTGDTANPKLKALLAVEGAPGNIPSSTPKGAVTFDDAWNEANSS